MATEINLKMMRSDLVVIHVYPDVMNYITKEGITCGGIYFLELDSAIETPFGDRWITFKGQAYLEDLEISKDFSEVMMTWGFPANQPSLMEEWEEGRVALVVIPSDLMGEISYE